MPVVYYHVDTLETVCNAFLICIVHVLCIHANARIEVTAKAMIKPFEDRSYSIHSTSRFFDVVFETSHPSAFDFLTSFFRDGVSSISLVLSHFASFSSFFYFCSSQRSKYIKYIFIYGTKK